jgi:hypothetical protein
MCMALYASSTSIIVVCIAPYLVCKAVTTFSKRCIGVSSFILAILALGCFNLFRNIKHETRNTKSRENTVLRGSVEQSADFCFSISHRAHRPPRTGRLFSRLSSVIPAGQSVGSSVEARAFFGSDLSQFRKTVMKLDAAPVRSVRPTACEPPVLYMVALSALRRVRPYIGGVLRVQITATLLASLL